MDIKNSFYLWISKNQFWKSKINFGYPKIKLIFGYPKLIYGYSKIRIFAHTLVGDYDTRRHSLSCGKNIRESTFSKDDK